MQQQIQSSLSGPNLGERVVSGLREGAQAVTATYAIYGQTDVLFNSCAAQADYEIPDEERMRLLTGKGPARAADGGELGYPVTDAWWFSTLGLPPTFATWSAVAFLHMYALVVRLRTLETTAVFLDYQRYLTEHFSGRAEDKMTLLHNISSRGVRNKYLKDLFLQWRGTLVAYDEGLIKGDAVLAAAIWRNLFRGQEDVDWEKVALVVAYLRKAITKLDTLDLSTIIATMDGPNDIWAQSRGDLDELVNRRSKRLSEPLAE